MLFRSLASLSPESIARLKRIFPPWMAPANPVDLWPGILVNGTHPAYNHTVEILLADPGVDAVLAHCFAGGFDLDPDLTTMARMTREAKKPLFCWISGEREAVYGFQRGALALRIPAFREIPRALDCMGMLLAESGRRKGGEAAAESASESPSAPAEAFPVDLIRGASGILDERRSKAVLKRAGIPVVAEVRVASPEEALNAAEGFGWPVVLKGIVPGILHKTEAGLVALHIDTPETLRREVLRMAARVGEGGELLLQPQLPSGLELITGLVRDPQFGPSIMCGLGGTLAEVLNDRVFAVAPLTHAEALGLIGRLRSQRLLDGFRGAAALDRNALADILVRLGALGARFPEIQEIDVNPIIVVDGRPMAVDASIIL